MDDKNQSPEEAPHHPMVTRPVTHSIKELLRYIDPAPDEETERFVAAIYADRREASRIPPPG